MVGTYFCTKIRSIGTTGIKNIENNSRRYETRRIFRDVSGKRGFEHYKLTLKIKA